MKNLTFALKNDQEYIPLINLLQVLNIAQSGGHAKIMVSEGEVKVNGEVELQKRKKIRSGDHIELAAVKVTIE